MHQKKVALLGLLAVVFAVLGQIKVADAAARWTFMVYLDGDNDLEEFAISDFLEMAKVGSTNEVKIVVQFDRCPGYDDSYGNWTSTKRFYITKDMTPTAANALADLGELNMGDPNVLKDFINWATANYPAEHYALILWNHGGGWREKVEALRKALKQAKSGAERAEIEKTLQELEREREPFKEVCSDSTSNDYLTMREVRNALNAANTDVDLIGFDACLMSMLEVAYEIRNCGPSVMVGSQEVEPGAGWPYNLILDGLCKNPSWTAAQLGSWIVEKYYASYGSNQTQAALRLNLISDLAAKVNALANSLRSNWNTDPHAIKIAAVNVIVTLTDTVINEKHGTSWPDAHGLCIYFPSTSSSFNSNYNGSTISFPADTNWEEFLNDFYAHMGGSWVASARAASQQFYRSSHIDLHDFCHELYHAAPEPGPGGYDYTMSEVAYTFEDISTTGTVLTLSDDSYRYFSIPFNFTFYGQTYNSISVSSNGTIYFMDRYMGYINTDIPADTGYGVQAYLAPFWDDLNPAAAGKVIYQIKGTAPNRRLIVQWHQVPHYNNIDAITFQAVLYEGSNNIEFRYKDVMFENSLYDKGASATVGIQKNTTAGKKYSYNTPLLRNSMALIFRPVAPSEVTYTMSTIAYSFEDISTTGVPLNLTDDGYDYFSIPFSFNFYGNNYNSVSVSANGVVYFADEYFTYFNIDLPGDSGCEVNKFVAVFWDDLNPGAGGEVYYQVKGTAPNRRLIVQWHQVPHYNNIGGVTFQAVFYETSNNIELRYQDVIFGDSNYDRGASATIGIQKDPATAVKFSYNLPNLSNSSAIIFRRSPSTPPPPAGGDPSPILLLLLGSPH